MYNLRDFKRAWIIYKVIKKGEEKMDKVKEFVTTHKKEIIYLSAGILIYNIGFKKGFKSAEKAITHLCNEAARVMEVK